MQSNNIFSGVLTAVITPFKDNKIDFNALKNILQCQIDSNIDGVVLCGSTGEGLVLTLEEYTELLTKSIQFINKRIKVIVGCCSSSTDYAIKLAVIASNLGCDGIMVTVPPYVKPTKEGIYKHFELIHDSVLNIPIMIYNIPSRTGINLTDDIIIKLSELKNIIAIKDAVNDFERPIRVKQKIKDHFNFLTGDDQMMIGYIASGGSGVVSVASNVLPKVIKKIQVLCNNSNFKDALELQNQVYPLYSALFIESNPIPVKYIMNLLGFCSNELRLPLTSVSLESQEYIDNVIKNLKIKGLL